MLDACVRAGSLAFKKKNSSHGRVRCREGGNWFPPPLSFNLSGVAPTHTYSRSLFFSFFFPSFEDCLMTMIDDCIRHQRATVAYIARKKKKDGTVWCARCIADNQRRSHAVKPVS
ncbi:Uncharacterized protein APZ42_031723 [Daphnia magna]|uniref:Uncharacterized protein n=1 Tax=Daphnia magna TaxID=35525 RepID=A0A164ML17_9CRUS|nr:Uncharacterized protein APZ42_031723 [Daphnia magna]